MKHLVIPALAVSTLLASYAAPASAHDFWLDLPQLRVASGERVTVATRMGHADKAQDWPLSPDRVVALRAMGPDGLADHQAEVATANARGHMDIPLSGDGVHVLSFESTEAFSELEAEAFESYLREEGLQPVLEHRREREKSSAPGREMYSRRGKALVVVGEAPSALPEYATRPIGLTLEIMLDAFPSAVAPSAPLCATVLYRGAPTEGVQIVLNALDDASAEPVVMTTDQYGKSCFERPIAGRHFLHTVWATPAKTKRADYSTVFSSFTFQISDPQ